MGLGIIIYKSELSCGKILQLMQLKNHHCFVPWISFLKIINAIGLHKVIPRQGWGKQRR